MNEDFQRRLKAALEALEPELDKGAQAPVAPAAADTATRFLTQGDQLELRRKLRKLGDAELGGILGNQMRKEGQGIPLDVWMQSAGGRNLETLLDSNPEIRKALDTSAGTALVRNDLEPVMYEMYIREFPAWDRFPKEPANGMVHSYNRQLGFGDAQFMPELGTVTDDVGSYERATTPITILATRRGVTLKQQYGTLAGGSGFNPEQLELRAGLRAMAARMQKTIFQGNATVSSGTASTEDGEYDVNAFDGLRKILASTATTVDPTAVTPENLRAAINDQAIAAIQAAGRPSVIYIDPEAMGQFDKQQDDLVRYIERDNISVGVTVQSVSTTAGRLPLFVVPGDAIGEYTISGPKTVSDLYLVDESAVSIPYLGSDGPTVLDIPMGVSGQLVRLFIIFGMWGLAVKATQFHRKVRVVRE